MAGGAATTVATANLTESTAAKTLVLPLQQALQFYLLKPAIAIAITGAVVTAWHATLTNP